MFALPLKLGAPLFCCTLLSTGVGTRVRYIKPHGALYHAVMKGGKQGEAVWEAAQMLQLPLMLMPHSPWATRVTHIPAPLSLPPPPRGVR